MESELFSFAAALDSGRPSLFLDGGPAPEAFVLEVDLASGEARRVRLPDAIAAACLGGRALAARLFAEHATGASPKRNPLVIAAGPVNNTLTPFGDSFSVAFQSPVTGRLAVAPSLRRTGACLRSLGLDAVVVKGTSTLPVVVQIGEESRVEIRKDLARLSTSEMEALLRADSRQSVIAAGPAAENRSPLAAPVCDGAPLARGGLGLLMAEKNIKAIVATPSLQNLAVPLKTRLSGPPAKEESALRALARAVERSRHLERSGAALLEKGRRKGFVPVSNFRFQTDPRIFYLLSKDEVGRHYGRRRSLSSPLLLNQPEPRPWEQTAMLGPNLGCYDPDCIKAWSNECLELGLDPVSVGNLIGWAIEERKAGHLEDHPELDAPDKRTILRIIRRLSNPRGRKLYGLMALGAGALEESGEFDTGRLMSILGLECGPWDYRGWRAQAVEDCEGTFLTCPCEILSPTRRAGPRRLARFIVWSDDLSEGLESAGFSHLLLGPLLCERESLGSFLAYLCPSVFLRSLSPRVLARRFQEATGRRLRGGTFRDLGRACRLLETGIDNVLGAPEGSLPAAFQTEVSPAFPRSRPVDYVKLSTFCRQERLRTAARPPRPRSPAPRSGWNPLRLWRSWRPTSPSDGRGSRG